MRQKIDLDKAIAFIEQLIIDIKKQEAKLDSTPRGNPTSTPGKRVKKAGAE